MSGPTLREELLRANARLMDSVAGLLDVLAKVDRVVLDAKDKTPDDGEPATPV